MRYRDLPNVRDCMPILTAISRARGHGFVGGGARPDEPFGSRSYYNPNLLFARLLRRELSAVILREKPVEMQQFL